MNNYDDTVKLKATSSFPPYVGITSPLSANDADIKDIRIDSNTNTSTSTSSSVPFITTNTTMQSDIVKADKSTMTTFNTIERDNKLLAPVNEDTPLVPNIKTLTNQVRMLERVLSLHPDLYDEYYCNECVEALKKTVMFQSCPEPILHFMAKRMKRVVFPAGSIMVSESEPMTSYVIAEGRVERWTEIGGRKHLTTSYCYHSVGLLHLCNSGMSRFHAECKTDVIAYQIDKTILLEALAAFPELAIYIIEELSWTIKNQTHAFETPLMQQKSYKISYTATAVAAGIEAFYRSVLNNLINQKLTGKLGSFFPHMHIQVPTRVLYISGLKNIRTALDDIDLGTGRYTMYGQMMICTVPGIMMCPFSSLLEAAHASSNKESMTIRWTRGFAPRLVREVIFAFGINQMADYFAERVSPGISENLIIRGAVGSVTAGVIAGYMSHIPHILSTMKMYTPSSSYGDIWREIYSKNLVYVPTVVHPSLRPLYAQGSAILFPVGVVRRFCQIAGTYTIINGLTFALSGLI